MSKDLYKRILTLFAFILIGRLLYANDNDSLQIQKLTQKVTLLENRVEILNDANNKLITVAWAVIGIVAALFTVFIGLNFWSNSKINQQKIDNIKNELKSYLEIDLFNKYRENSTETIKSIINQEIMFLKHNDKVTEHKIREIHIHLLNKELGKYTNPYGHYKMEKLISLLNLYKEVEDYYNFQGNSAGVQDTLKLILNYVKENKIDIDDKKKLLEHLNGLNENYKFDIDEIAKNIKT